MKDARREEVIIPYVGVCWECDSYTGVHPNDPDAARTECQHCEELTEVLECHSRKSQAAEIARMREKLREHGINEDTD